MGTSLSRSGIREISNGKKYKVKGEGEKANEEKGTEGR
jgi:hypothetical protein